MARVWGKHDKTTLIHGIVWTCELSYRPNECHRRSLGSSHLFEMPTKEQPSGVEEAVVVRGHGVAPLWNSDHKEMREKIHCPCQGTAYWSSPCEGVSEEPKMVSWQSTHAIHNSPSATIPWQQTWRPSPTLILPPNCCTSPSYLRRENICFEGCEIEVLNWARLWIPGRGFLVWR